ncbi:ABC transporter substrate-binding protein [Streptomyces sp. NPDC050147]|uniref:ABC transporter substrate-binding protein n=1 Tax=Streptomyces sp. NPDC050147 TaxID=3155513 RepID=UPI0034355DF8
MPALTEPYTLSADGKVLTFKLCAGAQFSDGSPLTADDDVDLSLTHLRDMKGNPPFLLAGVEVAKSGDSTLTLTSNPHEPSGGQHQRRRVAIAPALAARPPRLLNGDKPLSALDASAQSQVATRMRDLAVDSGGAAHSGPVTRGVEPAGG